MSHLIGPCIVSVTGTEPVFSALLHPPHTAVMQLETILKHTATQTRLRIQALTTITAAVKAIRPEKKTYYVLTIELFFAGRPK